MHYYLIKSDVPLNDRAYGSSLDGTLQSVLAKLAKKVYPGKSDPPKVEVELLSEREYEMFRAFGVFFSKFEQHIVDTIEYGVDKKLDEMK